LTTRSRTLGDARIGVWRWDQPGGITDLFVSAGINSEREFIEDRTREYQETLTP
jgi:hypothetical protein